MWPNGLSNIRATVACVCTAEEQLGCAGRAASGGFLRFPCVGAGCDAAMGRSSGGQLPGRAGDAALAGLGAAAALGPGHSGLLRPTAARRHCRPCARVRQRQHPMRSRLPPVKGPRTSGPRDVRTRLRPAPQWPAFPCSTQPQLVRDSVRPAPGPAVAPTRDVAKRPVRVSPAR